MTRSDIYFISELNRFMINFEGFKNALSTDPNRIANGPATNGYAIAGLYAYFYKRPELIGRVFKIDMNTHIDNEFANTQMIALINLMVGAKLTPAQAVSEWISVRRRS